MPSLIFTAAQMSRPLLANRSRLEADLLQHLLDVRPALFEAYPLPYLHWLVGDTLDIAAPFGLDDVEALRVFLQLRFDIAPGFYREPDIAAMLGRRDLAPMARWQALSETRYGDAWLRAGQYQGAGEWRERFWGGAGVTDKYNEALGEQLKKNVWDRTAEAAANMSPLDKADLLTSVTGIFDPTPVSDGAGMAIALVQGDPLGIALSAVSLVPYLGDAVAKPFKIARKAPKVAAAIEAMFKGADNLAGAGKAALKDAGLSLEQVAAARKKALESVQQAMLDAKKRIANCETCKLKNDGKRQLQMPQNGPNGKWAGGATPVDGNGIFKFNEPKVLPDGREVSQIEFKNGAPNFDQYVEGGKHELWQVTGDVRKDGDALKDMMREKNPGWLPPDAEQFTLHHFEDGTVGYVPQAIHDRTMEGVAHTGGNSMINNQLF